MNPSDEKSHSPIRRSRSPHGTDTMLKDAPSTLEPRSVDLLDELELLFWRKGRNSVLLVASIVLALCFLVVGILMATLIMLVTFFLFLHDSVHPPEPGATIGILGATAL